MEEKERIENMEEVKTGDVWQYDKEGDNIFGELKDVVDGQFSNNYLIQTPEGKDYTVFGSVVLATKMSRVEKGKLVRITFIGEVKASSGRTYKDFKVEVEK